MTDRLFAYGTLLPGDVRWRFLEPFVLDHGVPDRVVGRLFDTGQGYPAAVFGADPGSGPGAGAGSHDDDAGAPWFVHGRVFTLRADRLDDGLALLDEIEGAVAGDYRRVRLVTAGGVEAWGYASGGGLELEPILGGRWSPERSRPLAD